MILKQPTSSKNEVNTMSGTNTIRYGWLKLMYIYTAIGASGFGAGILFFPEFMISVFQWPDQDPVVFGVVGSVYLAFAIVSLLGLRTPLKFVPILVLQLCYKLIWFAVLVIPMWLGDVLPYYALLYVVIFASYVIGDLIAIPFSYFFSKQETAS